MNRLNVIVIAAVAFLTPLAFVAFQHRDEIQQRTLLEPWQGTLLYFTSPT